MKALHVREIELSRANKSWYNREGYEMTGETLVVSWDHNNKTVLYSETEYVVFKGTWTRSGTVRDCGDHYIYAGYSSYYRIDKKSLEVTTDVEDK